MAWSVVFILPLLVSFFTALLILPLWIKVCKKVGLTWEDMNKPNRPKNVASSGGVIVLMGFILGVLSYIAIRTSFEATLETNIQIFALLSVILIFAIIGLVDDLLGWKSGGLSKKLRVILAFLAAIPISVINAGHTSMSIPLLGTVDLGILYPVIIIPLGIAGASTTYNFLAGFNGLEAGLGIITLGFLSFVAYVTGTTWLALIGLIMVAALIAFYFYNKVPAKVFPGDIMTYSIGSLIAIMAILGNFQKIAVFVFTPFILEVILKLRGKLEKHSFGLPQKDGSLKMPYDKIYGLTHLSVFLLSKVKKKVYENDVVYSIFALQLLVILLAYLIFLA